MRAEYLSSFLLKMEITLTPVVVTNKSCVTIRVPVVKLFPYIELAGTFSYEGDVLANILLNFPSYMNISLELIEVQILIGLIRNCI